MYERGDCLCLHEPFMYYYYVHLGRKTMPHFKIDPDHPTTFGDIIKMMMSEAANQPVFAKDMAYYVLPEIMEFPDLATSIRHVFLVRDPRRSLLSYHELDKQISVEEVGVNAQFSLYQWIEDSSGHAPLILLADTVQADPLKAAQVLWQYQGLEPRITALQWDANDAPETWQQVDKWHEKTMQTSRIQKESLTELALREKFDFASEHDPQLQQLLDAHWVSYQELRQRGLEQWREVEI